MYICILISKLKKNKLHNIKVLNEMFLKRAYVENIVATYFSECNITKLLTYFFFSDKTFNFKEIK